jgi:hypothetical protein
VASDWHEQAPRWAKLWDLWWSSPSHAGFGPEEHAVGLRAMCFANRFGRQADGSGLVCLADGKPIAIAVLARGVGLSPERAAAAVEMLVSVGTFLRRAEDGGLIIPHLQKWQEDPSTARHRRRNKRDGEREIHAPTHGSEVRGQRSEVQRAEVGGRKEEEAGTAPAKPAAPVLLPEPVVMVFPAQGRQQRWELTEGHLASLQRDYPRLDVKRFLERMRGKAERGELKHIPKDYTRAIGRWVSNEADDPRSPFVLGAVRGVSPAGPLPPPEMLSKRGLQNLANAQEALRILDERDREKEAARGGP